MDGGDLGGAGRGQGFPAVRCGVCRRRDWDRGGPGRGDFLGTVTRDLSGLGFGLDFRPFVRGANRRTYGRCDRASDDLDFVYEAAGGARRWRPRCRRGHRLRWDDAEVARQLARGETTVWLPAA
jgi:hypothetical protein